MIREVLFAIEKNLERIHMPINGRIGKNCGTFAPSIILAMQYETFRKLRSWHPVPSLHGK